MLLHCTGEERDLSKWAHDRLSALLLTVASEDKSVQVTSIKSVSGDATIVFSRGKKKYGYDLSIIAEWTLMSTLDKSKPAPTPVAATDSSDDKSTSDADSAAKKKQSSKEICGKISLPCIDTTVDEGEHQVVISCEKDSQEAQAALASIRKQKSTIIELIDRFVDEFKQQ